MAPSPDPGPVVPAPGTTPPPAAVPRGAARFTVRWAEAGSLAASQSVKIVLMQGDEKLGEGTLARPAVPYNSSSISFTELAPATVTVQATAHPNADGTGTAQASGLFAIVIEPGRTTEVGVNLSSTIRRVAVVPGAATLARGDKASLAAFALDANSQAVLNAPQNWTWTSDNPAVASVTSDGDKASVTGGADGTATITVREAQSGATASARITVAPYSASFDNGAGPEWSNTSTGVTPVGARKFLGPFSNESARLTLNNLPPHAKVRVTFDLLLLQSWDGNNANNGYGPDFWQLSVEGRERPLVYTTFSNFARRDDRPHLVQAFPSAFGEGEHSGLTGATEVGTLGYSWLGSAADSVYRLSYEFDHSASSLTLKFMGEPNQSIDDESWGLDNVTVQVIP